MKQLKLNISKISALATRESLRSLFIYFSALIVVAFELSLQTQVAAAATMLAEGARLQPNFSGIIEAQAISSGDGIFIWLLVVGGIFLLAKFSGFGYLSSALLVAGACIVSHLNIPVVRLLYAESALATTVACGLSLIIGAKILKFALKEEGGALARFLKNSLTYLTIGAAGLLVYSYYNELDTEQIFNILNILFIVVVMILLAVTLLRQAKNFLQFFVAMGICFLASFTLMPGVFKDSDSYDYQSLMNRGENSLDVIVMALREEHFNITDFLNNLELEFGEIDLENIDLRLLDASEIKDSFSPLHASTGLGGFSRTKAVVVSEQILQKILSNNQPTKDSRAQVSFDKWPHPLKQQPNTPAARAAQGPDVIANIRSQLPSQTRLMVLASGGKLYDLASTTQD